MRGKGVTIGARGTSGIASLISGMTLRERRALHESVKRRILLKEEQTEASLEQSVRDKYKTSNSIEFDSDINVKYFNYKEDDGWLWQVSKSSQNVVTIFLFVDPRPDKIALRNVTGANPPQWLSSGQKYNVDQYKNVTYEGLAKTLSGESSKIKEIIDTPFDQIQVGTGTTQAPAATTAPAAATTAPAAAADKNEPSDESPTGARLMKGDIEVFRKTDSGWKATLRLTLPQILSIIKPEYQPEVKEDLTALGDRDELPITKGYLKNPGMSFTGGGLTFQRDGELFADPVAVPGDKLPDIMKNLGLTYDVTKARKESSADTATGKEEAWAVGNVIFKKIRVDKMTITVQDDGSGTYADFSSIFGTRADVPRLIQKAAKKNGGKIDLIKIPLRFADESSLMGKFGGFLGMGAIKFEKEDDKFVCTLERPALVGRAIEVLNDMADEGVNRARKLASASSE